MNRMYRFQRHIYDGTRRYYLLGRERMIETLNVPSGGTVLEVGCGTGRNLIRVAQTYPGSRLYGFDISSEMLTTAQVSIARHGLNGRISVAEGDAGDFDPVTVFDVPCFDRVFLSYTLSMIPDWKLAVKRAVVLVAPGGELHITDFGNCSGFLRPLSAALLWWLDRFDVKPREDLEDVLAEVGQSKGASLSFQASLGGYAVNAKLGPFSSE